MGSSMVSVVGAVDSTAERPDADTLRFDAAGRPVLPLVLRDDCEGEDCLYAFPAAVCRPTVLRAAPDESAPIVAQLAEGDTVNVKRELHVKQVGVVVLKQSFVLDRDIGNVEDPTSPPRSDTVHFTQGDTIYLIRYLSLGAWRWAHRGQQHDSYVFWNTPPDPERGVGPADSSRAAIRSWPVREDWWHVRPRRGTPGWLLGTEDADLVSTSDVVHPHEHCPKVRA